MTQLPVRVYQHYLLARMGGRSGNYGALADAARKLARLSGSAEGSGASSFRLPVIATRGAPRSR